MGLGLSIAKKNALLCGGDIELMPGELTGAAYRVTLPNGVGGRLTSWERGRGSFKENSSQKEPDLVTDE
jgi:hypothetical protein